MRDQIVGDQHRPGAARGFSMQPQARLRRVERRSPLREQRADDPGEHVAGAGAGKPGRGQRQDGGAAIGVRDDAVGPFQQQDRTRSTRGSACLRETVRATVAEQAHEFAPMRRQHMPCQTIMARSANQRQRIGIEQQTPSAAERRVEPDPRHASPAQPRPGDDCAHARILERALAPAAVHQSVRGRIAIGPEEK